MEGQKPWKSNPEKCRKKSHIVQKMDQFVFQDRRVGTAVFFGRIFFKKKQSIMKYDYLSIKVKSTDRLNCQLETPLKQLNCHSCRDQSNCEAK